MKWLVMKWPVMKWLKDPLVAFLAVGALLLLASQQFNDTPDDYRIIITPAEITRLSDQWQMQMRRAPTQEEMDGLIDSFIQEEIYYREAMRMGLDADDTIVRRRLVQKLTFLTEDIATAAAPDEAALRDYYDSHTADYTQPPRISFVHRYFSVDRREQAEADAKAALANAADEGDPFMLQKSYAQRSEREIGDLFGRAFATELFALDGEGWLGPVRSAYGWHVVRIEEKLTEDLVPFAEVKERVLADWQMQARKAANDAWYKDLKSRYTIEWPTAPSPQPSDQPAS